MALHTLTDRALRDSLRHPEHLRSLLRQAVPELAEQFDYFHMKLLDREFTLEDWRGREADLLYEVPFGPEAAALVCVIIEHQSDPDPLMSLRTLLDATLYWERQWHRYQRSTPPHPPLRLCPVLPIVFYTGAKGWRKVKTLRELMNEPAAFHRFTPDWRPIFWNLSDHTPDELLSAGEEWLLALAVIRAGDADTAAFQSVFAGAIGRLNQMSLEDRVRWSDLIRLTMTLAFQRRPPGERPGLTDAAKRITIQREQKHEVTYMAETIADALVAEGEAKGVVKGRAQASIEILHETIEVLGRQRFDQPTPRQLATLESIQNPARLVRMRDALLTVKSWRELLAIK